jgi:hypothetical protein
MPVCCVFATDFKIHMSPHLPTINFAARVSGFVRLDRSPAGLELGKQWKVGRATRAMLRCSSPPAGVFRGLGAAKSHGVRYQIVNIKLARDGC